MKRMPKVGDQVTLASSSDAWIVDQVLTHPEQVVLRLNHMPTNVQTVPWAALRYLHEERD
jgi:hypothetical protein